MVGWTVGCILQVQSCFTVPRSAEAVPVVNRRGPRVTRSDRHGSNAAERAGGPC